MWAKGVSSPITCFVVTLLGCHWNPCEAFRPAEEFKSWRRHVQGPLVTRTPGLLEPASAFLPATAVTLPAFASFRPKQQKLRQHERHQWASMTLLSSSSSSSDQASAPAMMLRDRLGLDDRFGRWRFLQRLLDGEVRASDANEILTTVLGNSLASVRKEEGSDGTVVMTAEQRTRLREFLDRVRDGEGSIFIIDSELVLDPSLIEPLDALLPGMDSDEDAHKGLWDTVIELHGREAVKIEEASRSPTWTSCCLTARLLLHYDFLPLGV